MIIYSVGDRVDIEFLKKEVGVHSVFEHVINLETDSEIVSFVLKPVGSGPNNVVVDDFACFDMKDPQFKEMLLQELHHAPTYDSSFRVNGHINLQTIKKNVKILKEKVVRDAHPLSCAFLLDEERERNFNTQFKKLLATSLKKNFERLLEFDLSAIAYLKGLGIGLTPQGDDLIEGFLASLYFYEVITGFDTRKLRKNIFELSKTENKISNTFLYYTYQGLFYERFKNVLNAIITGKEIEESANKMLSFGETSGADILTGFIKGFEKLTKEA